MKLQLDLKVKASKPSSFVVQPILCWAKKSFSSNILNSIHFGKFQVRDLIPSQAAKTYLRLWQLEKGLNYVSEISRNKMDISRIYEGHFIPSKPADFNYWDIEKIGHDDNKLHCCWLQLFCQFDLLSVRPIIRLFFLLIQNFSMNLWFGKNLMNQKLYSCYCGPP